MTCGVKLRWRRETCKPETKPWPVDTLMAKCSAEASPSGTVPGMSSPCVLFRMPNVSIHSRPIRRLTEAADGQGSCALPLPEGRGYEKGFHRLRRLVNHFFPLKGEVSNHKGIFDGPYIRPPGARPAQEHSRRGLAGTAIPACGIDIEYLRLLHRKSRDDILPVKIFHEKLSVFQSLFHQDDFHKFRAAGR